MSIPGALFGDFSTEKGPFSSKVLTSSLLYLGDEFGYTIEERNRLLGMRKRRMAMRKTKIVCTIGPACDNEETLERMCLAGMNVARLNFSHGTHPEQQQKMDLVKMVREKLNLPIAIMLDTKGPEYRIRTFENGSITLREGDTFTFTTEQIVGNQERVSVSYPGLIHDLEVGDKILLNNGLLVFEVEALEGTEARCRGAGGRRDLQQQVHELPQQGHEPGLPQRAGQGGPAAGPGERGGLHRLLFRFPKAGHPGCEGLHRPAHRPVHRHHRQDREPGRASTTSRRSARSATG